MHRTLLVLVSRSQITGVWLCLFSFRNDACTVVCRMANLRSEEAVFVTSIMNSPRIRVVSEFERPMQWRSELQPEMDQMRYLVPLAS
ncbi:hypothetical protein BDQ17DRAFT_58034 [Cyathus striatus]|nr:hypothetical protein BDQ17DRAFT_58034 [Cyathus striatus]